MTNENKIHNFFKSLKSGEVGQERFLEENADLLTATDGRSGDFEMKDGSGKVELKYEANYTTTSTINFFVETISNDQKMTLGGPWQAQAHGCLYYVHMFSDGIEFWFKTDNFIPIAEKLINSGQYKMHSINNRSYYTNGYALPREFFKDILLNKTTLNETTHAVRRKSSTKTR